MLSAQSRTRCVRRLREFAGCAPSAREPATWDAAAPQLCRPSAHAARRQRRPRPQVSAKIVDCAELHRSDGRSDVAIACQDDSACVRPLMLERRNNVQAAPVIKPHIYYSIFRCTQAEFEPKPSHIDPAIITLKPRASIARAKHCMSRLYRLRQSTRILRRAGRLESNIAFEMHPPLRLLALLVASFDFACWVTELVEIPRANFRLYSGFAWRRTFFGMRHLARSAFKYGLRRQD